MTKKQLYILIALLSGVLLYVLFMPVAVTNAPEVPTLDTSVENYESSENVSDTVDVLEEEVVLDEPETLTIEGTFVGLLEAENRFHEKFSYLLLDDGSEVFRVDLRPLIGMSDIDIIAKLGVNRGDEVVVTGTVTDGEFSVESIE
ncbi:MAG: hypothetical protein ACI92I_000625 [Acidimicrobiales bacterium]|jgi:hypothetical protein